jgi:hypothetical protein
MKNYFIFIFFVFAASCSTKTNDSAEVKKDTSYMSCKLTTPELEERKTNVLSVLRKQVLDKKELDNGYAFKFKGSDEMIDSLIAFAKYERQCCDFFTFNISINGDTTAVWLNITGPKGAKQVIKDELEL